MENSITFRTPNWVWGIITLNIIVIAGLFMIYNKVLACENKTRETRNIVKDILQHTKYIEPIKETINNTVSSMHAYNPRNNAYLSNY